MVVPDFKEWRTGLNDFGRIVRGTNGLIKKIVEFKDASDKEKKKRELNLALYAFDAKWLWANIDKIKNKNAQAEYYLTDLVKIACKQNKKIETVQIANVIEGSSAKFQRRIRDFGEIDDIITPMQNPYQNAMAQLDKVAKIKKFPNKLIARLKTPDRDIKIEIPVKMDDGKVKTFEGLSSTVQQRARSVQGWSPVSSRYRNKRSESARLLDDTQVRCSGIPMGGGKGGITVEPKDLSKGELERLSRGWVRGLADVLGPHKDVPAPDVNTTPEIMAWMADEFGKITGVHQRNGNHRQAA